MTLSAWPGRSLLTLLEFWTDAGPYLEAPQHNPPNNSIVYRTYKPPLTHG
jgi:hypothetical protein